MKTLIKKQETNVSYFCGTNGAKGACDEKKAD